MWSKTDLNLTRIDTTAFASYPRRALQTVVGYARILRVPNLVIVAVGVYVGGALDSDEQLFDVIQSATLALAALAAVLISGGANALNDVMDVDVDRVNRPMRPLVVGTVSTRMALVWAGVLFVAGVVVAALLSGAHLQLAIAVVILMIAYDVWLKRLPLVGNIVVSASVAATLVFGAITTQTGSSLIVGVVFAFMTTMAREIIKDLEDMAGDSQGGLRTFPVVAGERSAAIIAALGLIVSLLLIPIPYLLLAFSGLYLIFGVLAAAALLGSFWMLVSEPPHLSYSRASYFAKMGMISGLVALLLSHAPE